MIGVFGLLIGACLLVLGGKLPRICMEILTTVIVGITLTIYFYEYLVPSFMPIWSVWWAVYVFFGLGLAIGLGSTKWPKLGILVIAAAIGFTLGEIIDILIIQRFVDQGHIANVITLVIIGVVCCLMCIFMVPHAVMFSSCLFGSYIFWRVSFV